MGWLFGNFCFASSSCCFASARRSSAIFASASLAIVSGVPGSFWSAVSKRASASV